MTENSLPSIVEQKTVLFIEDEVIAVRLEDGSIYVPLRPLTENLGLSWAGQYERLQRDEVLSKKSRSVRVTRTEPDRTRQIEMICLPIQVLNGWLFSLSANRIKDEAKKARIIAYKERCYDVLWEAFQEGRLSAETDFSQLLKNDDNPSVQAYKMAQAIMHMARQQIVLEGRIDTHDRQIEDNSQRIDQLETIIGDTKHDVTPAQASQVSQAVKAVAMALGKRSGRNEYGGVYGELYRRFEVTSYKQLPKNRFEEAMQFLTNWYGQITGDDSIPF